MQRLYTGILLIELYLNAYATSTLRLCYIGGIRKHSQSVHQRLIYEPS